MAHYEVTWTINEYDIIDINAASEREAVEKIVITILSAPAQYLAIDCTAKKISDEDSEDC